MSWVTRMTSSRRAYIISGYWNSARVRAAVLEFADEAECTERHEYTSMVHEYRASSTSNANESKTTSRGNNHQASVLPVTPGSDGERSKGGTTLPREHPHSLVLTVVSLSLFLFLSFFYAGRKKGTAAMRTVSSRFAYESLHYSLLSFRRDYISNSGPVAGHPRKKGNTTRHI